MKNNNIRFLIVDDFPTMRDIIQNHLVSEGYENVQTARNGADALAILKANPIDLVISDWNMPVMNGLELVQNIRGNEKLSNIPVLMITAEASKNNITQMISAGINDLIVKPFKADVFYKKINAIFSGKSPIHNSSQKQTNKNTSDKQITDVKKKKDKPEILVVDDLPDNIDIIVGFLKDTYKLRAVNSGKKAIKIIESANPPDLVLLDIMMPEMDGISVCKHLKKNPLTADVPVIFLTAKTDRETLVEGFQAGAVDYLTKPVNAPELLVRVKNHIRLKSSQDELREQVDTLVENARLRDDVERMSRHDLKTPISSIISLTACLQEQENIKNLGDKTATILNQIDSSAFLLMDLINQSLNLYKIETGSYQFSPEMIAIDKVISQVINDLGSLAQEHEVQLLLKHDSLNVYCMLEELLCYSIFSNLIKNAVEASQKNTKVTISIKKNQEQVSVEIHNDSTVPEVVRNSFFAKYVTHGKPQGTGLGTYSAKIMTEVQNGKIQMDTDSSRGTTVTTVFGEA